jgi:hypothetical protein
MKNEQEIRLLEELANILAKQIELARHGQIEELEKLVCNNEQVAIKIMTARLLERPEHDGWRKRLTGLYKDLELMLSAQKDAVAGQLKSIHLGKKTLTAYRSNLAG